MVRAMMKKIKIIDLLNRIANGEEVPKKIKYASTEYEFSGYDTASKNYKCEYEGGFYSDLFSDIDGACLNNEVEILDDEEDKDIPLIPDDELIILKQSKTVDMQYAIDFNFKVLKEKINQVVKELNRRSNEEESSNKD